MDAGLQRHRSGEHRLGFGLDLPQVATCAAAPTAAVSVCPPSVTGKRTTRPTWVESSTALEGVQSSLGFDVSMADLIVLGGTAAVEAAATAGGDYGQRRRLDRPRRRHAGPDRRREPSPGSSLAGTVSATTSGKGNAHVAEHLLVDKAQLLGLSAPGDGGSRGRPPSPRRQHRRPRRAHRQRVGALSNDFFVNLMDIGTAWTASETAEGVFEGTDRATGAARWTGTRNDLVFGSNSILRAIADVYAADDAGDKFVADFAARRGARSWTRTASTSTEVRAALHDDVTHRPCHLGGGGVSRIGANRPEGSRYGNTYSGQGTP